MPGISTLKVFYSSDMVSHAGRGISPSDRKPLEVSLALGKTSWPIELVAPEPTALDDICRVHEQSFVADVLELRRASGFGSISASVARSLPFTSGALYDASVSALKEGISASLSSGFHHAGPRAPRGFCTFNGLMIAAARLLHERRAARLAIVDCDYHYGDGTQAIIDAMTLSDRVLHVSFGLIYKKPEQAPAYLTHVRSLRATLAAFRPDIVPPRRPRTRARATRTVHCGRRRCGPRRSHHLENRRAP